MKFFASLTIGVMALLLSNCTNNQPADQAENTAPMSKEVIMEVTTFNTAAAIEAMTFKERDAQVESDFTSQQPGFITRQSGVNEKGEYVVIVFWETTAAADASMNKFMGDASVADYAQMIDGPTMKMARYIMTEPFVAGASEFVEVMSFDLKEGTDVAAFNDLNQRVETDFTGKRTGFLQRLMGVDETGKQAVAVYWASKAASDASLEAFMADPTAQEFMGKMDAPTMVMGRYEFLNR